MSIEKLKQIIRKIDGKGYKAYKELQGSYQERWYKLHIDHVQGDPFATPSRIRYEISQEKLKYPENWFNTPLRKISFEDFLTREIHKNIMEEKHQIKGSGKSGLLYIDTPGQEILPRTAVKLSKDIIEIRLSVGLPAIGRKITGKNAQIMLIQLIPNILEKTLFSFNKDKLRQHLKLTDQQEYIRKFLAENGYVAFIANGSILPRESGVSNLPLKKGIVVPFQSPPSLEIEIPLPHEKIIKGMAIPKGVTLIVGGGYHGKSTLLKAIERGVYNHIPGDGREYVITVESAVKIRAEDGRRVEKVNISPFISNLPFGKETTFFSTDDASGSTSQAANIIEALEIGTQVLLIDEDTSATNFMIRDARMQKLVAKNSEPITPFVDKVRQLYEELGVSSLLVLGGSGDYFDVADRVIMMNEYKPVDVTERAKEITKEIENKRQLEGGKSFGKIFSRVIFPESFNARKGKKEKVEAKGLYTILYGINEIDLSLVEQLVDKSQTRAIAYMINFLAKKHVDGRKTLPDLINLLFKEIEEKSLDIISPYYGQHPGDFALPRKYELAAALNRLRTLKVIKNR